MSTTNQSCVFKQTNLKQCDLCLKNDQQNWLEISKAIESQEFFYTTSSIVQMCTRIRLHSLSIKSSYLTILLHTNAHCSEFSGGTATLDGRSSYLIFIELLACKICRCRRPCKHNITIMSLFIPPTFVEIALLCIWFIRNPKLLLKSLLK